MPIPSSSEEIRLVDDAFGKISHMVSDGSWMVRVQAAKTLVREHDNTQCILDTEINKTNVHVSFGQFMSFYVSLLCTMFVLLFGCN